MMVMMIVGVPAVVWSLFLPLLQQLLLCARDLLSKFGENAFEIRRTLLFFIAPSHAYFTASPPYLDLYRPSHPCCCHHHHHHHHQQQRYLDCYAQRAAQAIRWSCLGGCHERRDGWGGYAALFKGKVACDAGERKMLMMILRVCTSRTLDAPMVDERRPPHLNQMQFRFQIQWQERKKRKEKRLIRECQMFWGSRF